MPCYLHSVILLDPTKIRGRKEAFVCAACVFVKGFKSTSKTDWKDWKLHMFD